MNAPVFCLLLADTFGDARRCFLLPRQGPLIAAMTIWADPNRSAMQFMLRRNLPSMGAV
ncbi:hypothetical protein [Caballeronia catudaia]|uniref:hypothetical protein n=1 Tax=Caballeronia catudaia TaxID=1777136 RepID=UPI000A73E9BE|nr:hypothetical protein [Caballeronia catudaia]